MNLVDPDGNVIETLWDIASFVTGIKSLTSNIKAGNTKAAISDGVGIVLDAAAIVIPGVPGGVGAGLKAVRAADKSIDAVKAADKVGDAAKAGEKIGNEAVKRRVSLRKAVKEQILEKAERTPSGDFIDPNTQKVIPKEGPYDIGHVKDNSWKERKAEHIKKGHTRKEVIEAENNPDLYHIEDPSSNRSRKYD